MSDDALAEGIRKAYLRGRFERATVDGVEWVFDVAHNPAAAAVFAKPPSESKASATRLAVKLTFAGAGATSRSVVELATVCSAGDRVWLNR